MLPSAFKFQFPIISQFFSYFDYWNQNWNKSHRWQLVGRALLFIFFIKDFFMWTILKFFIEFATILLLFHGFCFWVFFSLRGMWDLSFLTRDRTCTPCIRRQSLNHWTTRQVPWQFKLFVSGYTGSSDAA